MQNYIYTPLKEREQFKKLVKRSILGGALMVQVDFFKYVFFQADNLFWIIEPDLN